MRSWLRFWRDVFRGHPEIPELMYADECPDEIAPPDDDALWAEAVDITRQMMRAELITALVENEANIRWCNGVSAADLALWEDEVKDRA